MKFVPFLAFQPVACGNDLRNLAGRHVVVLLESGVNRVDCDSCRLAWIAGDPTRTHPRAVEKVTIGT